MAIGDEQVTLGSFWKAATCASRSLISPEICEYGCSSREQLPNSAYLRINRAMTTSFLPSCSALSMMSRARPFGEDTWVAFGASSHLKTARELREPQEPRQQLSRSGVTRQLRVAVLDELR